MEKLNWPKTQTTNCPQNKAMQEADKKDHENFKSSIPLYSLHS